MGKNIFYFVLALAVLAVVGGGIFYLVQQRAQEDQKSTEPPQSKQEGLGGQLNQNPSSKIPETNPFQQARTNPFEEGETNPFKGYKNPFE